MIVFSAIPHRKGQAPPKPRQSPDGFSLKTFPENLGNPGQTVGWARALASVRRTGRSLAALRFHGILERTPFPLRLHFSICHGLTRDPRKTGPSPKLSTCERDLIWK